MISPEDRTDDWLRQALGPQPRPTLDAQLSALILRRVADRERDQARPAQAGVAWVLRAYWLAAGLGAASLLARVPWPHWAAPVAWGVVLALVPVGFALALWPGRARAWLRLWLVPLVPLVPSPKR